MSDVVYKRAPITEAIIEIRYPNSNLVSFDKLESLVGDYRVTFPTSEDVFDVHAHFGIGSVSSQHQKTAKQMKDKDGSTLVRFGTHSYTFIQTAPYTDWLYFRGRAEKYWGPYSKHQKGTPERIGLRFVNRIDIDEQEDIREWINIYPKLPEIKAVSMTGFLLQYSAPLENGNACSITTGLLTPAPKNKISIALDIDVSKETGLTGDSEHMWNILDTLRGSKNMIFEQCITDKLREMIR